jgi:hydrophobic/amphiphilic exporter-1 (mainly G- bacteria), HAE1 family
MFSRFFIDRPIFANVIAIVTMLLGALALIVLPVEQYPNVTPPTIQVSATYPGANASVVADTVATPIEQQVNGVENMMYMTSSSSSDGSYALTVTFEIGTHLDDAQVLVQNRVAQAEAQLPEEVQRQGVTVRKQSPNIILVISLVSPDGQYDSLFLSNYATLRLREELSRVKGVGEVTVFGTAQYSMRVWLDPDKLQARRLTTQDVTAAIREQNVQVAAGQVGQPPAPQDQNFQYTVTVPGRLSDVEQFENIIVKTGDSGQLTYLKDVARVELGAQSYDQFNLKSGQPNANIGIYQSPGANALEVAEQVKQVMERLRASFPAGMTYELPLDTTEFIDASIYEVYKTLIEAGILVLIVILVFLQNWRAVLVPATTVPVTIIGAFIAMALLGFTVNLLTLFGLVLAIGIVVDDAIVIVENATRHIESGMSPREATIKAMGEVLGPIIGMTLVLLSVFLPSAFLPGITGQLYRQFALTIAATALLSAINALTLKPAQCAAYLRPPKAHKNLFARAFDAVYDVVQRLYVRVVRVLVAHVVPTVVVFVALVVLTAWWYGRVPTGFLPTEDQGYILVSVQLPDAASQQRTRDVMKQIDDILADTPGVKDWITIGGLSLLDRSSASNSGTMFITFEDWGERETPELSQQAIVGSLAKRFSRIQEAIIFPFVPPSIRGLGFRGGFQLQVEDRAGVGLPALFQATQGIIEDASGQPSLTGLNSTFRPGVPQLMVDVDREKVKKLGIPLTTVFQTLQAYLGSTYVNDFNKFGRIYQVRVQAEAQARAQARDILRLEVRNAQGDMIPLGSVVNVRDTFGPQVISRYNLYPSASISGESASGYSSGQALEVMEQIAQTNLPDTMGYEWTGIAYEEKKVGGQAIVIFGMAVLLVYLVLAAQYENWLLPAAVILVVPLGLLGALAAVTLRGIANDVYTQIGMVLIIALASKNAILIVEFARELRASGRDIRAAAIEAAQLRFRPILMTSFTFILGVLPLVVAQGAGAASQRALGSAVFGGMIVSTILSLFFVPVFFVVFQSLSEWRRGQQPVDHQVQSAQPHV